jgi:hypothetical protein
MKRKSPHTANSSQPKEIEQKIGLIEIFSNPK